MRSASLALSFSLLAAAGLAQQAAPAKPAIGATSAASGTTATVQSPAVAPAASTAPANPITDAQARKMLEMTGADKTKDQLMHGMMNYFRTSIPFAPKDVYDDLEQSLEKLDLDTPIIAIYKQHISTEDADSIIEFYKTPAGKDLIKVLPEMLQQSQQIGMQLGRKTAQDVIARHRPELEEARKQYQAEHSPKPPSLNTPALGTAPGTAAPGTAPASPSGTPATPNAAPAAKPGTTAPQPQ